MTTKSRAAVFDGGIDTNIKWQSNDKSRARRAVTAVVAALAIITFVHFGHQHKSTVLSSPPSPHQHLNQTPNQPFRWADIPPSRTLTWHPCYLTATTPSGLDCARLDVPLDWLAPSDDHRVTLAVIRLRASTPDKAAHRGPIIFNPGGPGGSGIWALRDHGRDLQAIVGEDYDIVSFDPRGVGASTPRIDCWRGRAADRALWELQEVGVVDAHPGVLNDAYARAGAFSKVCEERLGGEGGLLRFSSTASSARDMREVMEQMGEKKLKYWGFSYGTVLGGTFAAMYPGLVERMVCDGNVDYNEWYHNAHINFLRDADKVMDSFYFHCHRAGPLRCAFHAATPDLIRARLDALLDTLRTTPVLVPPPPSDTDDTPSLPELITYSKAKRMIATALYQPILRFPSIAVVLAGLELGDGTPYQSYTALDGPPSPLPLCPASPPPHSPDPDTSGGDTPDAFSAVLCADAPAWNETPSSFAAYAAALQTMSRASGAVNVASRLSCAGRGDVRAKWRFAGPFAGVETHHPLLFVSNEADNVTPLVSARNNSAGFVGSRVLVQRGSVGHTSLAAGSRCTAGVVRGYFREGRMPREGEVCDGDGVPFGEEVAGEGDDEVGRAVGRLMGDRRWVGGFGG
ncbi:TAP-like protein-domain-containing protein [Schizothecium vesticola]|uniref:TAP-like protein-domain-containing protein n=1 Tax=Schizothecium vesticola TaxID=314040 RepID=A0AA40FAQ7_9PEZI|nr:TAP-like protein-domain-containing protein [Schizothecium vesticola]